MSTLAPTIPDHARATILDHLRAVREKEPGVRSGGDEEDLHDMRVASRRLRAAAEVFEPIFPAAEFARASRDLRALTRALGTAREWDVHVAALARETERAKGDGERAALEYARGRIAGRRARERARMLAALDRLDIGRLEAALRAVLEAANGAEAGWRALAAKVLPERIDEAWGDIAAARATHDPVALHENRNAKKKLRYALEILEPFFAAGGADGARAREAAHADAKKLQELLGKHHDRWLLAAVLDAERERLDRIGLWALAQGLSAPIARLRAAAEESRAGFVEASAERTAAGVRRALGV